MRSIPIEHFQPRIPMMKSLLRELVEIESPSTEKAAVDRLGARIIQELMSLGGSVEVIPSASSGDQIIWRHPGQTATGAILLLSHMDTVFNIGTIANMPFYEKEGKLFGPGVIDMKASIVMLLTILGQFSERNVWPDRPIAALFTSDEETGSATSRAIIEDEARKSGLALCLEPALANGAIKTARKGTGDIEIETHGVAAHAGIDHAVGRNAIEELAHHILAVQALTDYSRGTTLNVGVVTGGTRGNVVPDYARALVDLRISSLAEYKRLENWVHSLQPCIPGAQVSARIALNRPPMPRDATMARTYNRAQEIVRAIGMEITEASTGGGSDANFVAPFGIPVLDGLGPIGDGEHSEREFVWIDSIAPRSAQLAALMLNL